jgi:F-type H+-transporting ATPase subunit b
MLTPNATFIGQIIVFLLLLWFIYAVVVPMIAKPVNERYKRIADGLAAAEAGQKKLETATTEADKIVREARERARSIEDQAQRRSLEDTELAKQAAHAESARIVAAGQAEAANEAARARDALMGEFGELVVRGASQLLEREIDARAHAQLIERLTQEIARG